MGVKVNYDDLKEFERQLQKMQGGFESFMKQYCSDIANRIIAQTVKKTPRVSGNLSAAWELGTVTAHGKKIEVEIKNSMEYATEVEYGHRLVDRNGNELRWVDGRFMMTTSVANIQRQMPLRYQNALKEYCRRLGIEDGIS